MSDEKPTEKAEQAGVDPPEAGRDRQRDSSPSFSHAVNAAPVYECDDCHVLMGVEPKYACPVCGHETVVQ